VSTSHEYQGQGRRRKKRGKFSQASTRRPIVLYDQHGREWTAQVGVKTGMPTGSITPNFRAPWYPDQQFLKVNPDNSSELFIDYKSMLLRRSARMKDYHKGAIEWARDRKIAAPETLGEYTDQIKRGYGAPPKPIEPIAAAMQGNRYILGLTTRVDARLERFVVKPRNEEILGEYDFRDDGASHAGTASDEAAPMFATAGGRRARRTRQDDPPLTDEGDIDAFDELGGGDGGADGDQREDVDDGEGSDSDDAGDLGVEELLNELEEEVKDDQLEETFDAEASGGRRVPPAQAERAKRQAPRRPAAKTATKGGKPKLSAQKRQQIGERRTLADGALPAVSD
jgi:hypothetical protein